MAIAGVDDIKARLRQSALAARAGLSAQFRQNASKAVTQHFFSSYPLKATDIVAGYWPIRDELDGLAIVSSLRDQGRTVVLPVVVGRDQALDLRVWAQGVETEKAGFGTFGPPADALRAIPDVLLMPLVGFDKTGTRLGYGGGYYDRTLASLPRRPRLIGLAFAAQELDQIPRLDHDVPLDAVITETGLRMFGETL